MPVQADKVAAIVASITKDIVLIYSLYLQLFTRFTTYPNQGRVLSSVALIRR